MDVYQKDTYEQEIKNDGSPVTEADKAANEIIHRLIRAKITPKIPVSFRGDI